MEGVPCFIDSCLEYFDVNTEDYVGEQGTITSYQFYSSSDGCWMVTVEMGDGEVLEVLECELKNYAMLSGKKAAKPAPVKKVTVDIEPMKPSGRGESAYTYNVKVYSEKQGAVMFEAPTFVLDSSVFNEKVAKVAF